MAALLQRLGATVLVIVITSAWVRGTLGEHRVLHARRQVKPCKALGRIEEEFLRNATIRDIEFIHIPKTGGTSMEVLSTLLGTQWGLHAWERQLRAAGPVTKDTPNECRCSAHHRPPSCLMSYFQDKITFAIVRHPTLRFISEFCWRNRYLRWDLAPEQLLTKMELTIEKLVSGNAPPQRFDCHLVPQVTYTEFADFVLYFERLEEDFGCLNDLLIRQEVKIPHDNRSPDTCTQRLTFRDLSPESLQKLEEFYAADFERFGYRRFSTSVSTDAGSDGGT
jgi:hypothetical protein